MLRSSFRLGHSDALRRVIRQGRMHRVPGFLLRTRPSDAGHPRFAISISEKAQKSSVKRNRVRRQLFGILRQELSKIRSAQDCYITVQKQAFLVTSRERRGLFVFLLKKARLL